jgi:pimeloyl-ACP methyl ester carboxylesterase
LPLILLGHSMGSFATQYYLVRHSELLSGAVLSGTSALDLLGTALQSGFRLEDMNAALPEVRTPFDWLSRDPAQVDAYIADPLCGFTVSAEGLGSMFANLDDLARGHRLGVAHLRVDEAALVGVLLHHLRHFREHRSFRGGEHFVDRVGRNRHDCQFSTM